MPFDLSKVLFVATANLLDPIPPALRDRMEIVHLPGYTEQEKIEIGKRFLVPKQMKNHGLKAKHIEITDEAMTELVRSYTHEAGVRNLERELANVMRKVARQVAEGRKRKTVIDAKKLADLLGPQRFEYGELEAEDQTGSAIGLVVTEVGGDVVAIEVTRMEGREDFILTGQLGEVMRESARAGLSWTRAHAAELGIQREVFEKNTLHIHVPAGGIPKDGPSAGITMATAIVSALTGIPVRKDVAMTGEITLRGRVLPIGGLKSKILAAHLSGAKIVILPRKNEKDLRDIPEEIRKSIKLVLVDTMDQVLEAALRRKPKALVAEPPKVVKGDDRSTPSPEQAADASAAPTSRRPTSRRSSSEAVDSSGGAFAEWQAAARRSAAVPAMEYKDYYAVLGVPRTASQAEIKKAFRKLARAAPPRRQAGRRRRRAQFKEINEANEVLQRPRQAQAVRRARARTGRRISRAGGAGRGPPAAGSPFAGFGSAAGGNVRYEFRTERRRRRVLRLLPDVLRRGRRGQRDPRDAGRGRARPAARRSRTSWPGWASTASGGASRRDRPATPVGESARPSRAATRRHEATAEITLEEAFHGTTRLVEVDGKRLEVTIPPGADTGTRIKLTGQGTGRRRPLVVVRSCPTRVFTRRGADLERELPLTLEEALLGAEVPVETLKGRVLLTIPAGTQNGRTFRLTGQGMPRFKGDGYGDLHVKARVVLPTDLSDEATAAARAFFDLVDQPDPARLTAARPKREPDMQLDRFTQKAQEAIVAAQAAAQRLDSPVLDAEHILSALVEPDDGIPAETLRRLGVDLPAFRGELAAILARRARIQGGSLSPRPARQARVIELAEEEARRLGDEYVSTEHLLLGDRRGRRRGPGAARAPRGRPRGDPPGAPERPRRPARHLARTRRAPTPRSRSTAAT